MFNLKVTCILNFIIQYNQNQVSAKHKDRNNVGDSYIIALGDYEGGLLKVWHNDDDEEPEYIDIKNKFYKFDGGKKWHESTAFTGTRLSLVFFNIMNTRKWIIYIEKKKFEICVLDYVNIKQRIQKRITHIQKSKFEICVYII